MRVSPVDFAFDTMHDVLLYAKQSAEVTHNHPEEIIGAQATALAISMARNGQPKEEIRFEISNRFGYDMDAISSPPTTRFVQQVCLRIGIEPF